MWKPILGIAVSRNGRVAVASDVASGRYEGLILQILSPSSDTLISVARRGAGPGELSGDNIPFASGDTFHIVEMRRLADIMYSDAGKYLGERSLKLTSDIALAFQGDSVDVGPLLTRNSRAPASGPSRRKIGEAAGRLIFPTSDSFVRRILNRRGVEGVSRSAPSYASSDSLLAIGDDLMYRISVFTSDGRLLYVVRRDLPPNRRSASEVAAVRKSLNAVLSTNPDLRRTLNARLDTLARENVPYFSWPGLRFDAAGRLWVIGQVSDSTFADVFSGSTFLGRHVLPCSHPGKRIAVEGKWLALSCQVPSSGAAPFQIQLYAIEESSP